MSANSGSPAPALNPLASGGYYARQSSGLVRQLSLRDTVFLNICYISIPLGLLYVTQLSGLFPGASLGLAVILAAAIAIPHLFAYGSFAAAMPRSGGDYLSISRSIHPFVGFLANSSFTLLQIFSTAFILNFVPVFALPALFQTVAVVTGDQSWVTWATTASSQNGQFFISGAMIVSVGLLAIFNVPLMLRFFSVLMTLSLLGVVVTVVALLFVDQNQFAQNFGKFESVSKVIADAHAAGLGSSSFSLVATFASITILFGAIGLGQVTSYVAGEVRQPAKTILRGMYISLAIAGLGLAVIAYLAQNAFGSDFLNSAQFLANSGTWPVPATPFINLFIGIAIPNVWLAVLLGIAMVAGVWAVAVPTYLFSTRNILAYSFDRVLPARLGEVSDRTHTPILGTVVVMLLMLGFVAGFVYSATAFIVVIGAGGYVVFGTFAIVGIAAVLFPFRRKDMFDGSPITKQRFAGIPFFSIVGIVDAVLMALYFVLNITNGAVTGATNKTMLTFLVTTEVVLVAIWGIAWVRARQGGLDLSVVQVMLPPE
jgi:APA family basic amino acid/polyamine antiporter